MMKKTILALALTAAALAPAQKSGVNVTTPTENMDVSGTMRIRSLPANNATNAIYTTGANTNSGTTPTQTFKATRTVVADANGVLGTVASVPAVAPQAEVLADDYNFIPDASPVKLTAAAGASNANSQVYTRAFTLARKALVVFSYSITYSFTFSDGNIINDGFARSIQNYLYLGTNGTRDATRYYAYDSSEYTSTKGGSTPGNMGNSSTYSRVMAPGSYNVYLWSWIANAPGTTGVVANFGVDTDSFQITAHYLE